ncbi:MAG: methyltransferase [Cyclobacteriaceae bacterium]|nr:MAG: methyltransferase [Cyclobacteriaceae bacterium]
MNVTLSCPACHNAQFEYYLATQDFGVTREPFNLYRCTQCGLLATIPQPDEDQIGRYYASSNYISHTGKHDNRMLKLLYLAVRRIALTGKRKLIEKKYPKGSLLDLGCGTGAFLHEMKRSGWEVTGVEPANIARRQAENILNQRLFTRLDELPQKSYRVITLWHVLEHLHRPDTTLKRCRELLEPGGLLVIAVPNPDSFDALHYRQHWAGFDVPRHLWHFTRQAMKTLLNQQGFTLHQILPMPWDAYYVSLLSEACRKNQNLPARFLKGFFTALKSNLHARKTGAYSSLLYLAMK